MVTAVCQECGQQFEYDLKPGFPRKYCFPCGDAKKASYMAKEQATPQPAQNGPVNPPVQKIPAVESSRGKYQAMLTSYAKDIFVAIVSSKEFEGMHQEKVMEQSINLVKQAKEAFE